MAETRYSKAPMSAKKRVTPHQAVFSIMPQCSKNFIPIARSAKETATILNIVLAIKLCHDALISVLTPHAYFDRVLPIFLSKRLETAGNYILLYKGQCLFHNFWTKGVWKKSCVVFLTNSGGFIKCCDTRLCHDAA